MILSKEYLISKFSEEPINHPKSGIFGPEPEKKRRFGVRLVIINHRSIFTSLIMNYETQNLMQKSLEAWKATIHDQSRQHWVWAMMMMNWWLFWSIVKRFLSVFLDKVYAVHCLSDFHEPLEKLYVLHCVITC